MSWPAAEWHAKDKSKHPKDKSKHPEDKSRHPKDRCKHPKNKSKHPTDKSQRQTDKSRHQTPKNFEKIAKNLPFRFSYNGAHLQAELKIFPTSVALRRCQTWSSHCTSSCACTPKALWSWAEVPSVLHPASFVSCVAVPKGLMEPPTASASE